MPQRSVGTAGGGAAGMAGAMLLTGLGVGCVMQVDAVLSEQQGVRP